MSPTEGCNYLLPRPPTWRHVHPFNSQQAERRGAYVVRGLVDGKRERDRAQLVAFRVLELKLNGHELGRCLGRAAAPRVSAHNPLPSHRRQARACSGRTGREPGTQSLHPLADLGAARCVEQDEEESP